MNNTHADKEVFAGVVQALVELYGMPISATRTDLYFRALKDLTIEQVKEGATRLMQHRTTATFPKPGEIREYALGSKEDIETLGLLAWSDFERGLRAGPYKTVSFENQLINDVVARMGGWTTVCPMEDSQRGFIRHEFLAVHRSLYGRIPQVPRLLGYHERNGPQPVVILKCSINDDLGPKLVEGEREGT